MVLGDQDKWPSEGLLEAPQRTIAHDQVGNPAAQAGAAFFLASFQRWVSQQPHKPAVTWINEDGTQGLSLTYQELDACSAYWAQRLVGQGAAGGLGLKAGETVLLVYPPSPDFIVAFLACLRAGVIAVPVFPPAPSKAKKDLPTFTAIQASCKAQVALTSSAYNYAKKAGCFRAFFDLGAKDKDKEGRQRSWPDLTWVVAEAVGCQGPPREVLPDPDEDDIAFLQYTSGSTSEPKGVMITHANLSGNLASIIKGLAADDSTVVVSWLPQYHDMGLIGSYLGCLYCGGSGYYMSPITFIRKPLLWVEVISKYRGTHIQAPNFAYGLVARRLHQAIGTQRQPRLDLSCVRHMINGAEPITMDTIDTFISTFKMFGLRTGVVFPTYGLAENTVYVTSNGQGCLTVDRHQLETDGVVKLAEGGSPAEDVCQVVGCGSVTADASIEVAVVERDEMCQGRRPRLLGPGQVGEVWVRGRSRAMGYFNRPQETQHTFGAMPALENTDATASDADLLYTYKGQSYSKTRGYLRTGDLGFVWDGQLYICGRVKDLIIIRGRNVYPQDIERGVETSFGAQIRGGCSAAFSLKSEEEEASVVYIAEVKEHVAGGGDAAAGLGALMEGIKASVASDHGLSLSAIYLLKPRTIPKTTSGKVARSWCKRTYLADRLQVLTSWRAPVDADAADGLVASVEEETGVARKEEVGTPSHDLEVDMFSTEELVKVLQREVAKLTKMEVDEVDPGRALMELGLDSAQGVQLLNTLENKCGFAVPDLVMRDPRVNVKMLAVILKQRGQIPPPVVWLDVSKLAGTEAALLKRMKARRKGPPPLERQRELASQCLTSASLVDGRFAPGSFLLEAPMPGGMEVTAYLALTFMRNPAWLWALLLACPLGLLTKDAMVLGAAFGVLLTAFILIPPRVYEPDSLPRPESGVQSSHYLVAHVTPSCLQSIPSLAESLVAAVWPHLFGKPMSQTLKQTGCPAAVVGASTVGPDPEGGKRGGAGKDMAQVRLDPSASAVILTAALQTGAMVVPCISLAPDDPSSRLPLLPPRRLAITTLVGRPLVVTPPAKGEKPTSQLIEEAQARLRGEVQRVVQQHKAALARERQKEGHEATATGLVSL